MHLIVILIKLELKIYTNISEIYIVTALFNFVLPSNCCCSARNCCCRSFSRCDFSSSSIRANFCSFSVCNNGCFNNSCAEKGEKWKVEMY